VAAALTLAACDSARSDLGTSNGPCYVALPVADGAVHGAGRLVGVRLVNVAGLRGPAPHVYTAATAAGAHQSDRVCLVAYEGRFASSAVRRPTGRSSGRFAVVVVAYPSSHLLGTVIFRRVPIGFGHSHFGA
jgi:hypothetical protein